MLAFFSVAAAKDAHEPLEAGMMGNFYQLLCSGGKKSKVGISRKCPLEGAVGISKDPGIDNQAF